MLMREFFVVEMIKTQEVIRHYMHRQGKIARSESGESYNIRMGAPMTSI